MNLTSPTEVRGILAELGVRPSKAAGQNFLIDRNILRILIEAADLSRQDCVLEIGPGLGVVTEALARGAGRVVAVEKDARLHAFLAERFKDESRLELIRADLLDLDIEQLLARGVNKVVANLPYATGSRMLVELATARTPPRAMVVTVQQEVARRVVAPPGGRERGLLTVWVELNYAARIVKTVSASCFWPRPEVASAIIRLTRRGACPLERGEQKVFDQLTRRAFMQRRKQMNTILNRWLPASMPEGIGAMLAEAGIDKEARPEELNLAQWCALTRSLLAAKLLT